MEAMREIIITDRQAYFDEKYPFHDPPKLTEQRLCIHCGEAINVGEYKVFRHGNGFEAICCPNAPRCNGTVIDWLPLRKKRKRIQRQVYSSSNAFITQDSLWPKVDA